MGLRASIILLVIILIIGALLSMWAMSWVFSADPPERQLELKEGLIMIDGGFVQAVSPVVYPNIQTLGVLAERIIWCESNGRPDVCNQQYGCGAGMGLFQLIPSTVKYCEGKLEKTIDPFNPDDNYECGMWLLENEGPHHWGTETSWWGSYDCWKEYR